MHVSGLSTFKNNDRQVKTLSEPGVQANGVATGAVHRARYKRPFDLLLVVAALVLLSPLWLLLLTLIPSAIWLNDRGRVFYVQERTGRWGRPFGMIKFRTMVQNAERMTGPVWAGKRDPRITKVGKVLRALHLDEIPQIINVLKGDMSLVGPRPERPELTAKIERDLPGFSTRLQVSPGIAGLAQACRDYHARPRDKLRYDNLYVAKMSVWVDIKLLVRCVWVAFAHGLRVLGNRGASQHRPHSRQRTQKAQRGQVAVEAQMAAKAKGTAAAPRPGATAAVQSVSVASD